MTALHGRIARLTGAFENPVKKTCDATVCCASSPALPLRPSLRLPTGQSASLSDQCQAEPGKIGDQGQGQQQHDDKGQGSGVKTQNRPFKTDTGNKQVDAQRR